MTTPVKSREVELRELVIDQRMSDAAIGRKLGVTNKTVLAWRQKLGISQPDRILKGVATPKRVPRPSHDQMIEMYISQKLTQKQIAKLHGVNQMTVCNWLVYYDIKARPLGGRLTVILDPDELRSQYIDRKWTMEQISKHFKCGESTVRQNLIRYGLQISVREVRERKAAGNLGVVSKGSNGYSCVRIPGHPGANPNGVVAKHRLAAESAMGRYLEPDEQVHHINTRKNEDQSSNLAVIKGRGDHARVHKYMEKVAAYLCNLTDHRPSPLEFEAPVFWGGQWITSIDLMKNARGSSTCEREGFSVAMEEAATIN